MPVDNVVIGVYSEMSYNAMGSVAVSYTIYAHVQDIRNR